MIKYRDPMLDSEFLKQLAAERERVIYAKVVALDLDENPIEEIQGRVTQGSVPVDGNSSVRRTCSLTLVAHELNINDYIWGLETKVQLYIGQNNKLNPEYPPIIWFKMGTFVLTTFNTSVSASGHTVSLQGKDKMCLLNGDVGGSLTALSYNWGNVTVINKHGYSSTEQIPIKTIIKKAVHEYAGEPWHNIILNDLDDCGLELLEYRGETPLYFVYNENTQEATNMTINLQQSYFYKKGNQYVKKTIGEMEAENRESDNPVFIFRTLADLSENNPTATVFYGMGADDNTPDTSIKYNLVKIEQGMTCGYRTCDLVYAGNLTSAAGEPITGMLDKIVKMLGNYEYFYNVDGQFVFQRKRTYVHTSWNNMTNNGEEDWVENSAYTASYLFSFEDGTLITSYQNNPNLANLKNDFAIWGVRKGVGGADLPIHMRYAIDTKPTYYTSLYGITYTTRSEEEVEYDKKNSEYDIGQAGYIKEPSRFGLSEDWWEVRDWAKAWEYSGLPIPTEWLGKYCPIKSAIVPKGDEPPATSQNKEVTFVDKEALAAWGRAPYPTSFQDDLIFHGDGTYWSTHGSCAHSYTEWLAYFAEGGSYEGGYAYFYKPQIPADELAANGGQGLILGDQIKYNCDWRELIYQMAYDFKKFEDRDAPPEDEEEPQVYRDNFLSTIKTNNPNWYPTGYTGYEHYYTDIYSFWRDLYDPEYETSYDVVSLTAKRFLEEARYIEYFYDAPIYEQCKMEDPFFPSIMYFLKDKDGEYIAQTGLLQTTYGMNPSLYYYIADTEIQPVPLITESYEPSNYYVKATASGYNKVSVNSSQYKDQAIDLSIRNSTYGYQPCVTTDPFNKGKLYFIQYEDEETKEIDYKVDKTITEDLYLKQPYKYYTRTITGGVINFVNCVKVMDFDAQKEYFTRKYIEETKSFKYTKVSMTEKIYTDKGYENPYFYAVISYSYLPCIHPKYDFDTNGTYYIEGDKEYELNPESPNLYWHKSVVEAPETLNFWFDFLDTYGELSQYSVSSVGDRPKAVNDNNVKAIYFRETPKVIFVENFNGVTEKETGYTYAQLPTHMEYLFSISSQGKSAKDVLDNYLYSYSYCTESITINAIPVYHLEPNTRIFVRDDRCGINGEYIVTRINYPLAANGTMSINATKVVDRIY